MIFSLFGAAAPSGFFLGALFSSLFAQLAWWPWAYWATAITSIACAGASLAIIPKQPESDKLPFVKGQLDLLGSAAGMIALVLINFAWNQGPVVGWGTSYTYSLLIVGIFFILAFFWIESRASHPLVPTKDLTSATAFVLGCVALGWASFGIWMYYLWQFLMQLRHQSPLLTTAQLVPVVFSGFIAAFSTGHLLHRLGPSVIMIISMLAFCIGTVLMACAPVDQTYWALEFISIVIMPFGMVRL